MPQQMRQSQGATGKPSVRPWHQASLTRSLPGAIRRPDVRTAAAGSLQALYPPILGGFPKLEEVWRLQMGLERCFVLIDLIEPDAIGIIGVLDHIKAQTAWLVGSRATGILDDSLDKLRPCSRP